MSDLCSIFNKITGCETPEGIVPSKDPKARYSRITVSLDEALTDKEFHLAGSFLGVVSVMGGASCTIKLDYIHSGVIDLREVKEIKANFNKLYITTDGTGGALILYVCQYMETAIEPETKTAYSGITYSDVGYTTDNVLRLANASSGLMFEQLIIRNANALGDGEIGYVHPTKALPNRAVFVTSSFRLIPKSHYTLTKVNPASIGFCSTVLGSPILLKLIGVFK